MVAYRLFIVGHPSAPPLEALYDVYCRFGNFAGASILQRKNYGYLYYTSPESALKAIEVSNFTLAFCLKLSLDLKHFNIQVTDEKMIAGMNIKVLKAEPKGEPSHKRKKVDV